MAKGIVKISELVMDEEVYPRVRQSWMTAYDYANSMKTGSQFPPIVIAKLDGKVYLIDGWHRMQAYRQNGIDYVDAEIIKVANKKEMYIEAVKRNAVHGRPFSFQEKIAIAGKLERMRVGTKVISQLLGMSSNKMKKFKAERMSYSVTGKPVVLKSPLKHLAGMNLNDEEVYVQEGMTGYRTQTRILDTVIDMLKNKMFNLEDKQVTKRLDKLKQLFKQLKV